MTESKPVERPSKTGTSKTIRVYMIPVEAMEQIIDVLRESPYKAAKPVLNYIYSLPTQDIPTGNQE